MGGCALTNMNKTEMLLALVRRAEFEQIEDARNQVVFSDLGPLTAAYTSLETWDQKAALIHLIQDHHDPRFRPLMLDFLNAPEIRSEDNILLTKAIAICYLDENDDDFMRYYNDTCLIESRVGEILRAASTPLETLPKQGDPANSTIQKARSGLKIFAVIAILIGIVLLAYKAINQNTLNHYRDRGIPQRPGLPTSGRKADRYAWEFLISIKIYWKAANYT